MSLERYFPFLCETWRTCSSLSCAAHAWGYIPPTIQAKVVWRVHIFTDTLWIFPGILPSPKNLATLAAMVLRLFFSFKDLCLAKTRNHLATPWGCWRPTPCQQRWHPPTSPIGASASHRDMMPTHQPSQQNLGRSLLFIYEGFTDQCLIDGQFIAIPLPLAFPTHGWRKIRNQTN